MFVVDQIAVYFVPEIGTFLRGCPPESRTKIHGIVPIGGVPVPPLIVLILFRHSPVWFRKRGDLLSDCHGFKYVLMKSAAVMVGS